MAGLDQRDELEFLDEEERKRRAKRIEAERAGAESNATLGFSRAKERLAELKKKGADERTIAAADRRVRVAEDRAERSKRVSQRETQRQVGDITEGFEQTRGALQRDALGRQAPENADVKLLTQLYDRVQGFVVQNQPREAYSAALDLLTAAKQLDRKAATTAVDSQGNPKPVQGVGPNERGVISFLFDKDSPGKLPDYLKRIDMEATAPQVLTSLSTATPQGTALPGQNQVTVGAQGVTRPDGSVLPAGTSLGITPGGPFANQATGPAIGGSALAQNPAGSPPEEDRLVLGSRALATLLNELGNSAAPKAPALSFPFTTQGIGQALGPDAPGNPAFARTPAPAPLPSPAVGQSLPVLSLDQSARERVFAPSPAAPATVASPGGSSLRVRVKATGRTGTIPANEYDPRLYDLI